MPKKKKPESDADQSARFLAEVERLVVAGELNPIDAEKALDKLVGAQRSPTIPSAAHGD